MITEDGSLGTTAWVRVLNCIELNELNTSLHPPSLLPDSEFHMTSLFQALPLSHTLYTASHDGHDGMYLELWAEMSALPEVVLATVLKEHSNRKQNQDTEFNY